MNPERPADIHIRMPFIDRFAGLRNSIQETVNGAVEKTKKYLQLHEATIRIKNDPNGVIRGHAHGGWTFSADNIVIKVDPNFPDREQFLNVELPRSVSHELHHSVRLKELPDEPRTLGAALVFEGLATCFENEVWGGQPSKWANTLNHEQIQELLPMVIQEQNNLKYNHAKWFFGTEELPQWTGYSIGVYLVQKYLQLHPGETAASLVSTPADIIFDGLRGQILQTK